MTQITQTPVIKGPEKSFKPSGEVEDSFTFSSFLKDATKLKQDLREKEKNPSLKDNVLETKDSEKSLRKEDQVSLAKDKAIDEDQSRVSESAKGLGTLNQNSVKAEAHDTQIIPVLGPEILGEQTVATDTLTEEPVIQDINGKNQSQLSPLNQNREALMNNTEVKMDVPAMNETFVEELKSEITAKDPMITDVKAKDFTEEKATAQIIPSLAKEHGEDSIVKNLKSKEFNETGIKTDIESKGEIAGKTKIESGSLKMSTLSDGKNVPKEENAENAKNLLDGLQPKGLVLDKSEGDNLKTDTGAKDQLAPAVSVERSAMDFRIQPKATPVNENFQKNLEMATDEIMNRVTTLKEGANTTMTLKLFPEDLGELEISLLLNDGKLTGKILTDHKDVRELFLKNIEELTNTLKDNKVNVTKFEVGEFTQNSFGEGKQDENRRLLQTRGLRQYGQKGQNLPQEVTNTKDSVQKGLNILA